MDSAMHRASPVLPPGYIEALVSGNWLWHTQTGRFVPLADVSEFPTPKLPESEQ